MKTKKPRKGGSLMDTLSEAPDGSFGTGAVYHGSRIALLVVVAAIVAFLFPTRDRVDLTGYEVGTVLDEDVIAQVTFTVPKTEEELENDRDDVAAAVSPTFRYRPEAADTMSARLTRFFARVDSVARARGGPGVQSFFGELSLNISSDQARMLAAPDTLALVSGAAMRSAEEILPVGVVDQSHTQLLTVNRVAVRRPGEGERFVDRSEIMTQSEFYERALGLLPGSASPSLANLLRIIIIHHLEYTYELDLVATEVDRDAARRSVPTVKERIQRGVAIVRANDQISEADLEILNAHQAQLSELDPGQVGRAWLVPFLGATGLNLLLLGVFGLLLFFYRPAVYGNFRWALLIAILVVSYFGAAAGLAGEEWPAELLPIVWVVLPVAILWDGRMALVLALVLAVLTGAQVAYPGFGPLATALIGGAAAALGARTLQRRSQVWALIAVVSGSYAAMIVMLAMVGLQDSETILSSLGWALGNTTVSAILAVGFLPVFEWFTGITTEQTLLEWADPNRPLLRRLALEAPGTYAHTINVANLAEAAATAIGANGLLARVGMYYHDVGKVSKPQYFIENQPAGRNPHDKLRPETSASIVREHVIEGLRLAKEAKIPPVLQAFITEHHGTQLISYFHDRAKAENGGEVPDPAEFRYPGPRPKTPETAVAMLADSVESATRALQDPTPERIRTLVESIVEGKVREGQFDHAPLTLRQISIIKEQLIKVLSGMYHQRIDYPATKHLTEARDGDGPEGQASPDSSKDDSAAHDSTTRDPESVAGPDALDARVPEVDSPASDPSATESEDSARSETKRHSGEPTTEQGDLLDGS